MSDKEKDPIYVYYEDMQVYINNIINSRNVNNEEVKNTKAPTKPKNLNEDLNSVYTKKVEEALVDKDTKVMDYYNAVRDAEKIFKLKYSVENLYKDRRFLIQGIL